MLADFTIFYLVNPFAANGIFTRRKLNNLPSGIGYQSRKIQLIASCKAVIEVA